MGISHARRKSKGSAAERELIHLFWSIGWAALRAAGSGSTPFPSPDLLVGGNGRVLAVEVKATKDQKKYFPREEITALEFFAEKFGGEAWIAIKFHRQKFYFIKTSALDRTEGSFVASLPMAQQRGLLFEELTKQ